MAEKQKRAERESEPEKKEEQPKKTAYETKYAINELVEAASAFHTDRVIVRAALKAAGKESYSMSDAMRIVTAFRNKEVRV